MKRFLLLGILLTFASGQTHASCATRNSKNCATPDGFMTDRKAGCAHNDSNCRKVFCESVCATNPCSKDGKILAMCDAYCTGFAFKTGSEPNGLLHTALKGCLGENAGLERASSLNQLSKSLGAKMEAFKKKSAEEEKHTKLAKQAHVEVVKLAEELITTANTLTKDTTLVEDLLALTQSKIRHDAGTVSFYEEEATTPIAGTTYQSTRNVTPRASFVGRRDRYSTPSLGENPSMRRVASRLDRRPSLAY